VRKERVDTGAKTFRRRGLIHSGEKNILKSMPANLTPQYLEAEARFGKDHMNKT
jgi:hypothetical protein